MATRIKSINLFLSLLATIGLIGAIFGGIQFLRIQEMNKVINAGKVIKNESYPLQQKFTSAYHQGNSGNFKHAIQTYNQIIDSKPLQQSLNIKQLSDIQYNIANSLFMSALASGFNDDGSLKDDAKYGFVQAQMAYQQALRTNPDSRKAKFNLSLLNTVLPLANKNTPKEQSGVELSNLPIGLP